MLKRQLKLSLHDSLEANRVWDAIPTSCRQQLIVHYARLIGAAAKGESVAQAKKESSKDEHDSES